MYGYEEEGILSKMIGNPIVWVGVVAILVLIFLILRYRTAKPDEALIINGSSLGKKNVHKDSNGNKLKIVRGGGTFVLPIIQRASVLSLLSIKLDVSTPEVYTEQGVPVMCDGTAIIKIGSSVEEIATASEQFLSKSKVDLENEAREVLEGHLRSILGSMTVEEIYQNRDKFSQSVQEVASVDLAKMGLIIVSFTIKEVRDKNGYLDSLGKPRIAQVKRDADIAEAEALKETRIKKAQAEKESQQAELERQTEIAEAQKEQALKQAQYNKERDLAIARAEQATIEEEMKAKISQKNKDIELQGKEAELAKQQLEATLVAKADADKYVKEQEALAQKATAVAKAEAESQQVTLEAEAKSKSIALLGEAEAERIRKIGEAEAQAIESKAEARKKMDENSKFEMMMTVLPEIAKAVNEPISNIDKVVSYGSGGVQELGTQGILQTFDFFKETMGLDMAEIMNSVAGVKTGIKQAEEEKEIIPKAKKEKQKEIDTKEIL